MSEPKYTGTEVELYTKQFGQRLEALTGRIGRCVSRDLDQTSLLDTTKLKMIGSIIEFARSNWEALPPAHRDPVRLYEWEIRHDSTSVQVFTSVGSFKFQKPGHEVYAGHDPFWFRSRRHP